MQAPPGWYPHPESPQYDAYWDGTAWTGDYRLRNSVPTSPQYQGHYGEPTAQEFKEVLYRPSVQHQAHSQTQQYPAPHDPHVTTRRGSGLPMAAKAGAALLAVIALVFSATFVLGKLSKSGASSPQEAMSSAIDALQDGDFLGLIDVVLPAERDMMRDPFVKGIKELKRLGVLGESSSAETSFIKYSMDNMSIRTEPVSDDVARVFLSGTMTTEASSTVELGPVFEGLEGFEERSKLSDLVDESSIVEVTEVRDAMFAAVRYKDRWYLSLGYSIAESVRREAGSPMPETGIAPAGASTPEAAVEAFMSNVESLDMAGLIANLHPGELGALQRYAPMFISDAQESVDNFKRDSGFSWSVNYLELETIDRSDNKAIVRIKSVGITGAAEGESFEISLKHTGSDITFFAKTSGGTEESGSLGDLVTSSDGLGATKVDPVFWRHVMALTVKKWDGSWYIAPVATLTDYIFAASGTLSQSDLREMLESGSTGVFGGLSSGDVPFFADEEGVTQDSDVLDPFEEPSDGTQEYMSLFEIDDLASSVAYNASTELSFGNSNIGSYIEITLRNALVAYGSSYSVSALEQVAPTENADGWADFGLISTTGETMTVCRFSYGPSFQRAGAPIVDYYCQSPQ